MMLLLLLAVANSRHIFALLPGYTVFVTFAAHSFALAVAIETTTLFAESTKRRWTADIVAT